MADYDKSKKAGTFDLHNNTAHNKQAHQYLEGTAETSWARLEPLLTPDQLISRFLFGIPLQSRFKNPETGKPFRFTPELLQDYIELAVSEGEELTSLVFMPTQFVEKMPYQREDWMSFGYMQLPHRPISSIERFAVTFSTGESAFLIPTQWLETANLIHGQLAIIPLAQFSTFNGTGIVGGGDGAVPHSGSSTFFNALYQRNWVSALFSVEYTAGFCDGLMPKYVNELIGCCAAIRVLTMLAATYFWASTSLGIDGMSQSVSLNPNFLNLRIQALMEQRDLVVRKLKKAYSTKLVAGTV